MNDAQRIATAIPALADGVECQIVEGQLRLIGPHLRANRLRRGLARLLHLADRVRVELDDIGRYVVERIDGRATMADLAVTLAAHLRLERREAEAALTAFMQTLLRRKLVSLRFEEGS